MGKRRPHALQPRVAFPQGCAPQRHLEGGEGCWPYLRDARTPSSTVCPPTESPAAEDGVAANCWVPPQLLTRLQAKPRLVLTTGGGASVHLLSLLLPFLPLTAQNTSKWRSERRISPLYSLPTALVRYVLLRGSRISPRLVQPQMNPVIPFWDGVSLLPWAPLG